MAKNKKLDPIEKIVALKIRLEQIKYSCESIITDLSFSTKEINQSIEAIQENSENKVEIISKMESSLKYFLDTSLQDRLNAIKSTSNKLKRLL